MSVPHIRFESKLIKKGYNTIVGLDEAGRGAWAGPIVAAAVVMPINNKQRIKRVNDSKLLSHRQREKLFNIIVSTCITWSVGIVTNEQIDEIGIGEANKLALEKAIGKIYLWAEPQYLLIDFFRLKSIDIPQKSIVKGDRRVYSIACASIIAKVVRDAILKAEARHHPAYGFAEHKGYGTLYHRRSLSKNGPCVLHRKSFGPIYDLFYNKAR